LPGGPLAEGRDLRFHFSGIGPLVGVCLGRTAEQEWGLRRIGFCGTSDSLPQDNKNLSTS
jgi:hypothetical protein